MLRVFGGLVVVAVFTVSCGGYNNGVVTQLTPRASFDLNCPEANLQFQCLNKNSFGECQEFGVRGCEKQTVYTKVPKTTKWVKNSETETNE